MPTTCPSDKAASWADTKILILTAIIDRAAKQNQDENVKLGIGLLGVAVSFFAAGLVVGLGLVAAAVKFTATRPDLLDLLDVGRAQFGALHLAESVLVPLACLSMATSLPKLRKLTALTLGCLLVKALAVQPPLHDRIIARLAGQTVADSSLHNAYTALAVTLTLLLLLQGALGLKTLVQVSPP